MFHLLEKIRAQSPAKRTFIAFSVSLCITGLIFVMWFVQEKQTKKTDEVAQKVDTYTPSDTLFKNMADMWGTLVETSKNAQEGIKKVDFSSTVEYTNQASDTPTQQ